MYIAFTVTQNLWDKQQAIQPMCGQMCITQRRQREVTSEGFQIK